MLAFKRVLEKTCVGEEEKRSRLRGRPSITIGTKEEKKYSF